MRLIDAEALKKAVENLVVGGAEGLKKYYENGSKSDENSWIGGIYDAWELINNAQTVGPQKIVAIPHELIEKLALCVVDTVENIDWDKAIEAYMKRPHGEWVTKEHSIEYYCSLCGERLDQCCENFCCHCGAEMGGTT